MEGEREGRGGWEGWGDLDPWKLSSAYFSCCGDGACVSVVIGKGREIRLSPQTIVHTTQSVR